MLKFKKFKANPTVYIHLMLEMVIEKNALNYHIFCYKCDNLKGN